MSKASFEPIRDKFIKLARSVLKSAQLRKTSRNRLRHSIAIEKYATKRKRKMFSDKVNKLMDTSMPNEYICDNADKVAPQPRLHAWSVAGTPKT